VSIVVAAVIFDLDGVLIDSEPVWEEVRRRYVADHSGQWHPDTQRRLMGMSTGEWARYLAEDLGVGRSPDQVARDVVAEMVARYGNHVPLIDGADRVVRALAADWPLGLASSSPPELIRATIDALGLTDAFVATLSSEAVARGKPAPDVYLAVAERLGVDPADCAAIEDSTNGIRSAAAAGMRVVAVTHPQYPVEDDAKALAALVVDDIAAVTPESVRSL
jgi:HAD superfamily hydrolase (TIGR01509 family)